MNARNGNRRNKLRTYRQYKQAFKSEMYLKCSMSRAHMSSYAKFGCGMSPIRTETGHYERLNYNDRTCFNCIDKTENVYVLLDCPVYQPLSESLFAKLCIEFPNIMTSADDEKLSAFLSCRKFQCIHYCAKICNDILRMRRNQDFVLYVNLIMLRMKYIFSLSVQNFQLKEMSFLIELVKCVKISPPCQISRRLYGCLVMKMLMC